MNSSYSRIPGVGPFFWKQEPDGTFLLVVGPWYWGKQESGEYQQVYGTWKKSNYGADKLKEENKLKVYLCNRHTFF